jgi:hypothetical protein
MSFCLQQTYGSQSVTCLLSSSLVLLPIFLKGFGGVAFTVKSSPTFIQIHKCGNENSSCIGRLATTSYTTRIAAIRLSLLFLFRLHNYHCTKVVRCVISPGAAFWCGAVVCHPYVATPSERLENIASYLRLSRILFPAQGTAFGVLTS